MERTADFGRQVVRFTLDGLDCLAAGNAPEQPSHYIRAADQLSEAILSLVNWEDRVLVPLATKQFTIADCRELSDRMARRRGFLPV